MFKMYPHPDTRKIFRYPLDRLLKLQGVLKGDGERCFLVLRNGAATDLTIGHATGIFSYVREYFSDGANQTSMEWAILPHDQKSGVFSAAGNSGSIIADTRGSIGGLLTGGSGAAESIDITYATPFFWPLERIKANGFPNAHLNSVMD